MDDSQDGGSNPRDILRAKWRQWARERRARMTPEEIEEARAKAHARREKRLATPEGRQKHIEQDRHWRANNKDRVALHRKNERERKRLKREAELAALLADPVYIEQQAQKEIQKKEAEKAACKRYYWNRKERLAEDPEAMAAYRALQKKHRESRKARVAASNIPKTPKPPKPKIELTEKEKEERDRRRREQKAKYRRKISAMKHAEREAKRAAEAASRPVVVKPKFIKPKMGRLEALMKWHGR